MNPSALRRLLLGLLLLASMLIFPLARAASQRTPTNDLDLRFWLENAVWQHRYETDDVCRAFEMDRSAVGAALQRLDISPTNRPARSQRGPLKVLPYPGGRHPRIGFLDGAINPQRDTKVSVFTPWDDASYVVLDLPEAIWSNLGLLYLAHTHVPTIWSKQGVTLEPLEWNRNLGGLLDYERRLPNGVKFGAEVFPRRDGVQMELWLTNDSTNQLSDLRVQMCAMLKGAVGFNAQTNANKFSRKPYACCRSEDGRRWIIMGWDPCDRVWANEPVPCLHSDPKFPDCPPGETRRVRGWFSFYEGTNMAAELNRLDKIGWQKAK